MDDSLRSPDRRTFLKTAAAGFATLTLFRNSKGEMINLLDGEPYPELVEVTIPQLQATKIDVSTGVMTGSCGATRT